VLSRNRIDQAFGEYIEDEQLVRAARSRGKGTIRVYVGWISGVCMLTVDPGLEDVEKILWFAVVNPDQPWQVLRLRMSPRAKAHLRKTIVDEN
jgi:hypothetical protein